MLQVLRAIPKQTKKLLSHKKIYDPTILFFKCFIHVGRMIAKQHIRFLALCILSSKFYLFIYYVRRVYFTLHFCVFNCNTNSPCKLYQASGTLCSALYRGQTSVKLTRAVHCARESGFCWNCLCSTFSLQNSLAKKGFKTKTSSAYIFFISNPFLAYHIPI